MKTPITDQYVADNYNVRVFDANHCFDFARRLELDRAALIEALEFYRQHMLLGYNITDSGQVAESALAAARANFPEP